MKKQLTLVAFVAVAVVALARPSWAFQSTQISTVAAGTVVGGQKIAQFSLAIRDVTNPFGTNRSSVTWSNVNPLVTTWKVADRLFVINSTVTDSGGGIKVYTDNTATDANPKFLDPTPGNTFNADSLASGLLVANSTATNLPGLPMAWSIKATSSTIPVAAEPNNEQDPNSFQWLYFTDEYNWALGVDLNGNLVLDPEEPQPQAMDAPFVTMINSIGIHFGQAPNEFGANPDGANTFVYMQANFSSAQVQTPYRTSTLRVEAFIQ